MKNLRLHAAPCYILYIGILLILADLCYVVYYAFTSAEPLADLHVQEMLAYVLLSHTLLVGGVFLFDLVIREQSQSR